jgi:hypothetical protein
VLSSPQSSVGLAFALQGAEDPGCQVGRATPVGELEQGVHVVSRVASDGRREPTGEAGVAKAIDPPGDKALRRQLARLIACVHAI